MAEEKNKNKRISGPPKKKQETVSTIRLSECPKLKYSFSSCTVETVMKRSFISYAGVPVTTAVSSGQLL
jgi:hypothetical protein